MTKNEQDGDGSRPANSIAKYSGLGFQMIAVIGLFTFAGYKIDQSANHQTKWVTALLALTGVAISMYLVFRTVKS